MEDISRELERELKAIKSAPYKPAPHKKDRKKKVIVVDDFGEMTSGEWIKIISIFLFILSLVAVSACAVLYYLYTGVKTVHTGAAEKIAAMERRIDGLIDEKEVLTAKLVILEKRLGDPSSLTDDGKADAAAEAETAQVDPLKPKPVMEKPPAAEPDSPPAAPEEETGTEPGGPAAEPDDPVPDDPVERTVSIEKFRVVEDTAGQELLVRFDIRNVSSREGDVAGYIFTVLRPEGNDTGGWLVVPTTSLANGIPQVYRKGQYFSIAHYKPVKFRIKNQSNPDFYKKAAIFVFNVDGDLIFEKLIDITESEE